MASGSVAPDIKVKYTLRKMKGNPPRTDKVSLLAKKYLRIPEKQPVQIITGGDGLEQKIVDTGWVDPSRIRRTGEVVANVARIEITPIVWVRRLIERIKDALN